MTDTVLQSFCERCGTRYASTESEASRERGRPKLGRPFGKRGAPRGLDEAAVATALPSADAFRETFHFCLACRQYTCPKCWDEDAGHCLSCGPTPETDSPSTTELPFAPRLPVPTVEGGAAHDRGGAWPTTDLAMRARPSAATTSASGSAPDAPPADPWTGKPADPGPPSAPDASQGRVDEVAARPAVDPWRDMRYSAIEPTEDADTAKPPGRALRASRASAAAIPPGGTPASDAPPGEALADVRGGGAPADPPGWTRASTAAIGSAWRARMALPSEDELDLADEVAHPLDRIAWDREAPRGTPPQAEPRSAREPASIAPETGPPPALAAPRSPEPGPARAPVAPVTRPSLPPSLPEAPSPGAPVPSVAARAEGQPAAVAAAPPPAAVRAAPSAAPPAAAPPALTITAPAPAPAMVAAHLPATAAPAAMVAPARAPVSPPQAAGAPRSGSKARPCRSCALPLSAQARFCRRCGVSQG